MSSRPLRLAWLPPLTVGVSAAIVAEVATAVLLYTGPGLVRSLTVVLGAAGLAFAGGLSAAPRPGPNAVERMRLRWLLCLCAFLIAAVFGAAWSVPGLLPEGRLVQAVGLVSLVALPLSASGSVLGGLGTVSPELGGARSAAAAALGACFGFVLTGLLLPRTPLPASLLLLCLVLLSFGGLVFGSLLGGVTEVRVADERSSPVGPVRVEEHRSGSDGELTRVLVEAGHERARYRPDGPATLPWELATARALMPAEGSEWRLLVVGGGASGLARAVVREHPNGTVHVLERTADVVELGRRHLATELSVGDDERVRVSVGNLEDLVKTLRERYDAVFVHTSALASLGGVSALSREARGRLVQAVSPHGVLVWGPMAPEVGMPELAAGWERVEYERRGPEGAERVVVLRSDPSTSAAVELEGFAARNGERPDP